MKVVKKMCPELEFHDVFQLGVDLLFPEVSSLYEYFYFCSLQLLFYRHLLRVL